LSPLSRQQSEPLATGWDACERRRLDPIESI
jgi:hypothetical protein